MISFLLLIICLVCSYFSISLWYNIRLFIGDFSSFCSVFYLAVLGFTLMASHLLGRCSTAWAMTPVLFSLIVFEIGSHFLPGLAWISIFLFRLPTVAGWQECAITPSYWLRSGFTNILPWLSSNCNLCFPSRQRHETPASGSFYILMWRWFATNFC
jgi:hypothetical protein